MNSIWLLLILAGTAVAAGRGDIDAVTRGLTAGADLAVKTTFGLMGVMVVWLGIMRVAEEAGLVELAARAVTPLLRPLFPGVPVQDPAMGAIALSLSANMLGLGSAATPMGIKAMSELQRLNGGREVASDAMCTMLAINTSFVTLVPATVIALRAGAGSLNAAEIVAPSLLATLGSTVAALIADRALRRPGGGDLP